MREKSKLLILILVVAFVFMLGFGLGNYFTSLGTSTSKLLKDSELNAESFLIEQQLIDTLGSDCDFSRARLSVLSEQLWHLGKVLDEESSKEELGEAKFDLLKKKFHLTQIKTYSLYKNLEKTCGKESDVILFYFNKNDPASKEQGEILDDIVNDVDAKVFAIEFAYAPEIKFLEEYYEIKKAPTLVINFKDKLDGLQPYDAVKKELTKWTSE